MDDNGVGGGGFTSGMSHDWAELTHECLINIFSRLSTEDRWRRVMFVCKSWFNTCKDSYLNSVFDLETHFHLVFQSARHWTPRFERKVDSMLLSVVTWSDGSLTEIRVRHCSNRSLSLVAERCPNLQVLSVKRSPHVTNEIMNKIASGCPNLRELDISYCYEISHESIALIGRYCHNLRIFRRNQMNWLEPTKHVGIVITCPQDGDSDAAAIGKFMSHLVHLELRFSELTAKGLALISEGCLNLECLDLIGCANITSQDIAHASSKMKNIKTIKMPDFYITGSIFHSERYRH